MLGLLDSLGFFESKTNMSEIVVAIGDGEEGSRPVPNILNLQIFQSRIHHFPYPFSGRCHL